LKNYFNIDKLFQTKVMFESKIFLFQSLVLKNDLSFRSIF